ncbi:MAG: hypothetical protein KGS72_04075 [Cyanobacteria bacterium REEB67]|nr:hypothetical protein [Cyanobacteria bacterium REEB67]
MFKTLFAPLLLLALTLGFALPASAAETWRPQFTAGQHVYLDPALQGGNNPVNLSGLESTYKAESAKNGVEVFFIMTLKGDEATPGRDFATARLREIMGNWGGQSGFPADRAVVCYVVRLNTDWTKSAVACNVASELGAKGLNTSVVFGIADHYSQHRGPNPDALLPQNPKGFAARIASETNQTVEAFAAQQIADQKQAEANRIAAEKQAEADRVAAIAHAAHVHQMEKIAAFAVPTILVLLVLGMLYARKRKYYNKAAKVISDWEALFQVADSNFIELDGHYLDFLKRQGDNWKDKFKGTTLTRYTAAISAYADLAARIKTAGNLLASAKKANDSANIFSVSGNELAFALLTDNDVTIDSKALSFEEQGLFGALVDGKKQAQKPNELLNDMDALFRTTNTTMADIMAAFEGSAKNKAEIESVFGQVETLKANLTEAGLSFAAYQPVYDRLVTDKDAFLAISGSDPLQAFELSKTVDAACLALKAKIGMAIDLRKSLSSTDKAIAAATSAIGAARAQSADYAYPDGGAPANGAATTYLFNEAGSNPDDDLAAAKDQLSNAIALVGAGRLEESTAAKAQAEGHAADVEATIKKVLSAKSTVQKLVPAVHAALDKLVAEIPGGDQALASLNASFLPKNFDTAPGTIAHAKQVQTATSGQLAAVKAAFFEQRFVAAAQLADTITGDIQGSRDGIIAVQTRLQELGALRQHAKAQTAANTQTSAGLKGKIDSLAFTTSAQTDGQFGALAPALASHQADVALAITDWPAAAQAADDLAHAYAVVETDIDNEKAAYDHAVALLQSLRDTVGGAVLEVNTDGNIVRQAAHNAVGQAQQVLAQAEAAITVAKSDWNALARRYEGNINTAAAAHKAATDDKLAYNDAATAINTANNNIVSVENGSYSGSYTIGGRTSMFGSGVSANCSQARAYLQQASQLLSSQRYEDAENAANSASQAAAAAQQAAEAQVEAMYQAALMAWQIEENARIEAARQEAARLQAIADEQQRQRDAEAAAQRQRDDDARASQQSSSSWDNSSGGGFSGSDNTSGGDFS